MQVSPERIAHFVIEAPLGVGGMGSVYRARNEKTGAIVALKLPHEQFAIAPRAIERFVQEGEIGRQVDHENVVRTLEVGEADGRLFLAMELVEGKTLRELLGELGNVPERLLREIALQAARGLGAIHAAGIIHRDLKPENLVLTTDQRLRIMDLGIAKLREAAAPLTQEGQFLGSLPYASPEQCGLGEVGPPADIYALGVVLHELATGSNPFQRENPAAAIRAQLEFMPPPPPGLSPYLREVIGTLLTKRPDLRFASGAELAAVLEEGEESAWWLERAARREQARPRVPVAHSTAIYGRAAALERLAGLWAGRHADGGAAVLIEGEAGIGKSRVVAELLESVGEDAPVLYGSFPPGGKLEGLQALVQSRFGPGRLEQDLPRFLTRSPRRAEAFLQFVQHGVSDDELSSGALEATFAELVENLAADLPTILVLEDLHFATEAARRIAIGAARTAERCGALFVLTARPDAAIGFDGERIILKRLAPEEMRAMIADALESELLGDQLAPFVESRTDGIPFYVLEMLRALREQGFVMLDEQGRGVLVRDPGEFAPTDAVRDLVTARLARIDAGDRRLLDVAAVQGHEFDAESIAAVLGQPLVRVLQDLAAVERGPGIVRAEGRRYRFDHHQLQEVLYASLPERLREEYHALLAERYEEALKGEPGPLDHLFLAHHHMRGSRPERGVAHLAPAIDHLDRRQASHEAAQLLAGALARPGLVAGEERFWLVRRWAKSLNVIRDMESELRAVRELTHIARAIGDDSLRAEANLAAAALHAARGRVESAGRAYDRAAEAAANDEPLLLNVLTGRSTIYWRQARNEEALRDLEQVIERTEALGIDVGRGFALINYSLVLKDVGRKEESVARLKEVLDLARRIDHRRLESFAVGNLGLAASARGDYEEAANYMEQAMEIAGDIGDRRTEMTCIGNLALVWFDLGQLEEALPALLRQNEMARALDDRFNLMHALLDEGWLRIERREFDLARARLDEVLDLARQNRMPRVEGHAQLRLARIERHEGNVTKALERAQESLRLLEEVAEDRDSAASSYVFLGRLAVEAGEADRAEQLFRKSVALCDELHMPAMRLRALAHLVALGREPREPAEALLVELGSTLAWTERREIERALST